ncbi:hypothetical protein [Rhizosaccharibacter radicis]|uniref:DUF2917 domain-containing protein n=1 Tax=Rhizosaccharibacter radicis TaxID=2782605 RepID=A0ABT1VX41_9PROT|nr:hypothetical protein [Acetobacteraceae bacterium KSS12]
MRVETLTRMSGRQVAVTVAYAGGYRTLRLEVRPHPGGGYTARLPEGEWCVRCFTEESAILMACAGTIPTTEASGGSIPWVQARQWRAAAFGETEDAGS